MAITTVPAYLASLPEDRRALISKARTFVRKHLPSGYQELISMGMIAWAVPLREFGDTYNGQPLWIVGLASQKNYGALHLLGAYGNPKLAKVLTDGYKKAGKKLDMGKACLRFKTWDDIETGSVAAVLAALPKDRYLEMYRRSRQR